jgi:hypothetical protein
MEKETTESTRKEISNSDTTTQIDLNVGGKFFSTTRRTLFSQESNLSSLLKGFHSEIADLLTL